MAYVLFLDSFDLLRSCSLRSIVNLPLVRSFRMRLCSLRTTLLRAVFHYAQPMVTLLGVWKMAMSAVGDLLLWTVYDVTYVNVPL